MITDYHAKYFAHALLRSSTEDGISKISRSLFDAAVDLNPYQIDAALFALKSPLSKGVILADEVGLGKTIEAALVLCQYWAERKRHLLNKNLEKQKGLYEVFSQDSINLEIYKDRAELLRNEEKKLKQDIKAVQLRILDKRNSINLTRATQDFLLHLRKTPDNSQMDFLIKTFMRIIFKVIYIQNQEIVTFELNEPWQTVMKKVSNG